MRRFQRYLQFGPTDTQLKKEKEYVESYKILKF